MTTCPCCFGAGGFDMRDSNAYLGEHLTDAELLLVSGMDEDWLECDECDGTGEVPDDVARDLKAQAVAAVDQVFARLEREGLWT